ncbi:MAG TPA: hypothetical protein PLW80_05410 [Spirochaetales bacterium]|nr:hypothetical protein [Spirochaetales bacterium]HPB65977.1 hypothetical protein [Spirochaetales bacterium]HPG85643.1 hypothetical protein [Spirochaetales bacterium]HQO66286.1 hypothetical protein [Spirochaetales bacterium]
MNEHGRKMVAPAVIVICLVAYYAAVALLILKLELPRLASVGIVVFSALLSGILIWTLVDRIKEIRKGEEDDLSKY